MLQRVRSIELSFPEQCKCFQVFPEALSRVFVPRQFKAAFALQKIYLKVGADFIFFQLKILVRCFYRFCIPAEYEIDRNNTEIERYLTGLSCSFA